MWLSRLSIRRPVFMTMVVVMFMVLGLIGLDRLPVDLFPKVSLPVLTVILPYPGASPEQVEQEVVRPVEDAVAGLQGLDDLYSTARESVAVITLVFDMDAPIREVTAELRDRVHGLAAVLPDGVEDPIFRKIDPAATPVVTYAVAGEAGAELRELVERRIKPRLEQVDGVGAVTVRGGVVEEVRVDLDLARLAELRIPLEQVARQLGYDTRDIPGGHLRLGEARVGVRAAAQPATLDELGAIVLRGYPAPVYLRDVARIAREPAEPDTLARVDGRRAVTFEVVKEAGANTVEVADRAAEVIDALDLPDGVTVEAVVDTSTMVRDMAHEMRRSLVFGALMAVLVVYLFMVDWRSTLISATALPTSIVTTFFFMWLAGFSLNLLSLVGMALAIGILIDDAVVVREVIYRHLEEGEDPVRAALAGTAEVALAVLATTLSILAVFIPVGFIQGMVGQFFGEFGLTIAIAVAVSLFVAFTVDPMLSARLSRVVRPEDRGPVARRLLATLAAVDDGYRRLLGWALDHGRAVIGIAALLFLASLGMASLTGFEFLPRYDRARFEVKANLPPSVSIEAAEARAAEIEAIVRRSPEVEHVYTVVGVDGAIDRVVMRVLTRDKAHRDRTIYAVQDEVRARLAALPGVDVTVADPPMLEGAGMQRPVEIELSGPDLDVLERLADEVRVGLAALPGATDVTTSYRSPRPDLVVRVDRDRAGAAGLSAGQVGMALRMAVAGQVVGSFRDGERTLDIRLRAREDDRTPEGLMRNLVLLSPIPRADDPLGLGRPVSLGDVATLAVDSAPAQIERHDRQRTIRVSCGLQGRALSEVAGEAQAMLDALDLPPDVSARILGETELARDSLRNLLFALGLAVIFVYAVLASEFDSFVHPFTIMLSLPLAVVGAFATVFLAGWPVGIPTMLGIILLMGLVTKNAILLVDRANQFRAEGLAPREAMLRAGHRRLRPILMTSLAMILGMVPPAFSHGPGSEVNQPLALPVIGGLVASTLLTLVVVPVVWLGIEKLRRAREVEG